MKLPVLVLLASLGVAGAAAAQGCPDRQTAGRVLQPADTSVVVGRNGRSIRVTVRDDLCVGDLVFAGARQVDLSLYGRFAPKIVAANTSYPVPTRIDYIIGLAREALKGLLDEQAETARSTGSLRPSAYMFGVAGLSDGSAVLTKDTGRLRVPITPPGQPTRLSLYDPRGRLAATASVAPESDLIELNWRPRVGRWRLVLDNAETSLTGGFQVADAPPTLAGGQDWASLSPADQALGLACLDVRRYGLAALQRASDPKTAASLLWYWSDPQAASPCAMEQ